METEESKEGRERVRKLLVGRLEEAGLRPAPRQTEAAYGDMWKRMIDHLAYMDAENLLTLAEAIMDSAAGSKRDRAPSEIVIRSMAHAIQAPPFRQHRIVTSWLASVEGPIAEAGGYLTDLFRWLRKHARPPLAWDMKTIREAARQNNHRADLLRDRAERGVITDADRHWLEERMRDEQEARRIVRDGQNRRAA